MTTGQEVISGAFPILPFTPLLLSGPHLRVAKVLVDCLACKGVVTLGVFVLAMVERFLRNPAAGTTLVGMHILTGLEVERLGDA